MYVIKNTPEQIDLIDAHYDALPMHLRHALPEMDEVLTEEELDILVEELRKVAPDFANALQWADADYDQKRKREWLLEEQYLEEMAEYGLEAAII